MRPPAIGSTSRRRDSSGAVRALHRRRPHLVRGRLRRPRRRDGARRGVRAGRAARRAVRRVRSWRAVSADRRRRTLRRADRRSTRAVGCRPGRGGPVRGRAAAQALRVPPRLLRERARSRVRRRAVGPPADRRARAHGVRARRDRPRVSGPALVAVLALLRLQRLGQPPRRRLGDDPASSSRPATRARRCRASQPRSATASTRGRSERPGARRSSSSSTAGIRSSDPPPDRTRTSTRRRSTWEARARRASAATTRQGRPTTCVRSSGRSPTIPSRREPRSRGSRSRDAGASSSGPPSTAHGART
jgi:hypothetical protein